MWPRTECPEGLDYPFEIDVMKVKQGQCCPSFSSQKSSIAMSPKGIM